MSELAGYGCSNLERQWDSATIKSVLALPAIVKGNRDLGELIIEVDTGWEKDALDKFFQGQGGSVMTSLEIHLAAAR